MIYEFDHGRFAAQLLPSFMRKPRLRAFLAALAAPLETVYAAFNQERARLDVEVNYNSQEMLFAFVLSSLFDPVQRRITVQTNTAVGLYISAYRQAERQPRTAAYRQGEGPKMVVGRQVEGIVTDFYVRVPAAVLAAQAVPLRRMVNKYKLAGKTYELVSI